jgi:pimeloyl-ACP methyl ester carboxylesterase
MTTTWVFLRGLTREAAHWGDFPQVFQQAMPQARIHLIDLPGNGRRHLDTSPTSVTGMVQACREALVREHIDAPVHLLAMSLGAMVAMQWAHEAPDEVVAGVLINTSVRPFSPFHHRLQPSNYPTLLRLALSGAAPLDIEGAVLRMTSHQPGQHDRALQAWVDARTQRPVSARNALRQILAAATYRAPAQTLRVPLLLLASERDRLVSTQCSRALAEAWGCPIHLHPQAGHDLPLDDPQWVAQAVRNWLNRTNPSETAPIRS